MVWGVSFGGWGSGFGGWGVVRFGRGKLRRRVHVRLLRVMRSEGSDLGSGFTVKGGL